jgi:hypothetical protein
VITPALLTLMVYVAPRRAQHARVRRAARR